MCVIPLICKRLIPSGLNPGFLMALHFSEAEFTRRRTALLAAMGREKLDALLLPRLLSGQTLLPSANDRPEDGIEPKSNR